MRPRAGILAHLNALHPRLHLSDRDFRQSVANLIRQDRKPICTTSSGGYYVARTQEELSTGIAALRKQARSLIERANALDKTLPVKEQGELF